MRNNPVPLLKNNVFKSLSYLQQRSATDRSLGWNWHKIVRHSTVLYSVLATLICDKTIGYFTHMTNQKTHIEYVYTSAFLVCHVRVKGHGTHICCNFQMSLNVIFVHGFDLCFKALYFKIPCHLVHKFFFSLFSYFVSFV